LPELTQAHNSNHKDKQSTE